MLLERRGIVRKVALRRFLEKNARSVARRVALTEGMLDSVLVLVEEKYVEVLTANELVEPARFIDSIKDFVQFLLDNKEAILELIEVLLGLF